MTPCIACKYYGQKLIEACEVHRQPKPDEVVGNQHKDDLQKRIIAAGFKYWRASDSHGVRGTVEQAELFIAELIGVEVEITANYLPGKLMLISADQLEAYINLARTVERILNPRESPYGGTLTDYAQPVHIAEIGRGWLELRKVENK